MPLSVARHLQRLGKITLRRRTVVGEVIQHVPLRRAEPVWTQHAVDGGLADAVELLHPCTHGVWVARS